MTDQKYSVTTADPSGYWLIPNGVNDPKQWACMDSADPVKEIDDLRAKLEEAEKDKARLLALIDEAQKDILVRSHSDVQAAIADVGRRLRAAIEAKDKVKIKVGKASAAEIQNTLGVKPAEKKAAVITLNSMPHSTSSK